MSEESPSIETQNDELELLKKRATLMGIKFHPNVGIDRLKTKINNELNKGDADEEEKEVQEVTRKLTKAEKEFLKYEELRQDAARLIRVIVTSMNPTEREWPGKYFSVGNGKIGMFKKYIPFNNPEGWHIPNIIYKHLLERECQVFVTVKGPRGEKMRRGKMIKEYNVEVLPLLTEKELQELAQRQAMANNLD